MLLQENDSRRVIEEPEENNSSKAIPATEPLVGQKANRAAQRGARYTAHTRDAAGRHLADECPECERIEKLERNEAATRKNCAVLLGSLRNLHDKHGCPYCLDCAPAAYLVKFVEHYRILDSPNRTVI